MPSESSSAATPCVHCPPRKSQACSPPLPLLRGFGVRYSDRAPVPGSFLLSIDSNPDSLRMDWLDPADPRPSLQRLLRDWLRVQIAFGLHPETFAARLRSLGSARKLLDSAKTPSPVSTDEVERHVEILRRDCVRMLPLLSRCYPERLAHLRDPALMLFLRGRGSIELLERPMVAIVGARAATVYGRKVARDLASELAALGIVVISGLARGVDGMAHEGALDAGGVTLAVQACGPERIYPPEHRGLASRIREAGLVLTEMTPGTPPRAPYFPLRNRLISVCCYEQIRSNTFYYDVRTLIGDILRMYYEAIRTNSIPPASVVLPEKLLCRALRSEPLKRPVLLVVSTCFGTAR